MTTFGKTGTTNDNKDKWFVGFTPYYVGAVWYGYDKPKSVGGSNPSVAAWKKVMQSVHDGLEDKEFQMPSTVEETEVCAVTGLLPRKSCQTMTAYFVSGRAPKKTCTGHRGKTGSYKSDDSESSEKASEKATHTPKKTESPEKSHAPQSPDEEAPKETTPVKAENDTPETVPEMPAEE